MYQTKTQNSTKTKVSKQHSASYCNVNDRGRTHEKCLNRTLVIFCSGQTKKIMKNVKRKNRLDNNIRVYILL